MCEEPQPPDNIDITEGQEPKDESLELTEELLDHLMPKENATGDEPTTPDNETITKGE